MSDLDEIKREIKSQNVIIGEIRTFMKEVSNSLHKLTEIQAHQEEHSDAIRRAFKKMEEHGKRIWDVEQEMPTLKLSRTMVFYGSGMVLLTVLGSLITVVVMS